LPPPSPALPGGPPLPAVHPSGDVAGRIFLLVLDDLHLEFRETPRTRALVTRILLTVVHDGDLVGVVTTGYSSISERLTYDRQVAESAIRRVTGGGLRPEQIFDGRQLGEVRNRARVAFTTAHDLLKQLEGVRNRRKTVVLVSGGYDVDPTRGGSPPSDTDLARELAELTRAANRANATIHAIDPRGLVLGADPPQGVPVADWNAYLRDAQDSLRVLAMETGGQLIANQNEVDTALQRIDGEAGDYYVLGYERRSPDTDGRPRRIEVRTSRPGVTVDYRPSATPR
jgi:VWFA-related protein